MNIPKQTLIFSPQLLFRKTIISQLELGLPVVNSVKSYKYVYTYQLGQITPLVRGKC